MTVLFRFRVDRKTLNRILLITFVFLSIGLYGVDIPKSSKTCQLATVKRTFLLRIKDPKLSVKCTQFGFNHHNFVALAVLNI